MSPIGTSGSPLRSASSTSLRKTGEKDGEEDERNGRGGRKESQNPPERRKKKKKWGGGKSKGYIQTTIEQTYALRCGKGPAGGAETGDRVAMPLLVVVPQPLVGPLRLPPVAFTAAVRARRVLVLGMQRDAVQ